MGKLFDAVNPRYPTDGGVDDSILNSFTASQLRKLSLPINVTLLGIVTMVSAEQVLNAELPITVTALDISASVMAEALPAAASTSACVSSDDPFNGT